ncbi:MAG: thioredoxin family protein [Acidobacteria bacterium]|nr:thioredoxin family protein [Acidobacteriota bacterium]
MGHLVELFYSEHCIGCPEARQVVRQFALERPDVTVVERDVAVAVRLARHYRLIATPAIVIDGGAVMYGVPRPAALAARVDQGPATKGDSCR